MYTLRNKIIYVIIAIIISVLSTNAYATEINLTSLASGDASSHQCILIDKFDEENHWKECAVCYTKINIQPHTKLSTTSMGTSCNSNNMRITTCSECNYNKSEKANYEHTPNGYWIVEWIAPEKKRVIAINCRRSDCMNWSYRSDQGYTWTNTDGSALDPYTLQIGSRVKTPNGQTVSITHHIVYDKPTNWIMNTNRSGNTLNCHFEGYTHSDWYDKLTDSQIINPPCPYAGVTGIYSGITSYTDVVVTNRTFDRSTGKISFDFSFPLAANSLNRAALGGVGLRYQAYVGGIYYELTDVWKPYDNNTETPIVNTATVN